jgi:hypothetical protein
VGAARVLDAALQPGEGIFQQGDRLIPALASPAEARIIAPQQLHQGGGDLLSRPPRGLALHGMPFAIPDRQSRQQALGQIICPLRPACGQSACSLAQGCS